MVDMEGNIEEQDVDYIGQTIQNGKKGEAHGFYGKHHSDKTKRHLSKCRNTSGYRRVSKVKSKKYFQGFTWGYRYYDENGKRKRITRVNIDDLKKEVLARGLIWEKY